MNLVVKNTAEKNRVISAYNMKFGQIGYRRLDGVLKDQDIFLRTYSGLVSLNDPSLTWENACLRSIEIELLPPGTEITLRVPGAEEVQHND